MTNLTTFSTDQTISTIELRDVVNRAREAVGEPPVENRHFLKRVEDELDGELGGRKTFTTARGGTPQGYYSLTLEQATLVGMRESKGVRRAVLTKLKELQQQVAALQAAQQAQEQQRIAERQAARLECRALATAVSEQRALAGKEVKPHHYSIEYDLINRIVLGSTATQYRERQCLRKTDSIRDSLSATQVTAIADLQRVNTSLVSIGMSYADRKEHLNRLYMRKYNEALCIETINSYA